MEQIKIGYKKTEVGLIPEDWTEVNIESAVVNSGLIRGPFGGALKKEFFVNSGYKVYEQKNAIYKSVELGEYYVDAVKFKELKRFEILEGDFILSCSGTIGRIYLIPKIFQKGIINQALLIIRLNTALINRNYFYYQFTSDQFQKKVIDDTQGGAMKNLIGMSEFRKVLIPIPPTITEQKAIAEALSDVDGLIANLEKLIAKKKAIKQGAMQQLLTPPHKGGKRLEGFSGEWEQKRLGEVGDCIIGLTYSPNNIVNDGTLVLRSSNIQNNKLEFNDNVYVNSKIPDNLIVKKDDILICVRNGSRQLIGKCAILDERVANQSFGAFMSVFRSQYSRFIFQVFQSNDIKRQIDENLGATINQITNKMLNSFVIPFPPKIEQNAICDVLFMMDSEISDLEKKKKKYELVKEGMMQELLIGKTRLI